MLNAHCVNAIVPNYWYVAVFIRQDH